MRPHGIGTKSGDTHRGTGRSAGRDPLVFEALTPSELSSRIGVPLDDLQRLARAPRYHSWWEVKLDRQGRPKRRNGRILRRRISEPAPELKAVQRSLKDSVLDHAPLPACVYGVRGAGAVQNADRHRGLRHHFCTDLQDFYPSVKAWRVLAALRGLGIPRDTAKLIRDLVTFGGSLPQGAPTSPIVANLVFLEADKELQALAVAHGLVYTRYADDLTFSGGRPFKELVSKILAVIRRHGFRYHHRKTQYKIGPVRITGAMAGQNRLYLPADIARRLEDPDLSAEELAGLVAYSRQLRARIS
jgi:RNA-directed DNA polymerase